MSENKNVSKYTDLGASDCSQNAPSWMLGPSEIFIPSGHGPKFAVLAETISEVGIESNCNCWRCVENGLNDGRLLGPMNVKNDRLYILPKDHLSVLNNVLVEWITINPMRQSTDVDN